MGKETDVTETLAETEALGGKPSEGTKKDKRLKENPTKKAEGDTETFATAPNNRWVGPLAVEGVVTGDQREFAVDSLTWADTPLTLRWNVEDSHGGEPHTKAVAVGDIQEVWRDGNTIMGRGTFDMGQENGVEAQRRVEEHYLRGISIDADDITDADVELIWPETGPEEGGAEDDPFLMLFAMPEKVVYHAGRIRAATLCDIPAFVEAYIALDTGDNSALAASVAPANVSPLHATDTTDTAWDAAQNAEYLAAKLPLAVARAAYAWVDDMQVKDGVVPRAAGMFLHHHVLADGVPGSANLTACARGIAIINGDHELSDDQRRGVYDHLAAHLRDAGQEPPPLRDAVVASVVELAERRPPREWFNSPRLTVPVGITVTDEGRVYGHAAQWGECHIGYPDACVTPPFEDEHPYFLTGEIVCDDNTRVAVGQITVDTGHAPLSYGASRAAEHYDNTGAAVADITVGNDDCGIWVAGAIRPHAAAARVHDLRAAGRVSGDWRRIGGQMRLVGLLGINVPGFPIRVSARIASGVQTALIAAGRVTVGPQPETADAQNERALRLIMDQLNAKVHG